MSVSVDAKDAKSAPDSDSPTSTAIDLGLGRVDDDDEPEQEQSDENVERRANASADAADAEPRATKKRRRVSFECADIVEFEPTVYTTSVTSGGVPVGLSLNERSRSRRRRVGRQNYMEEGYLDPQEREIILNNAGCEEPVIASVEAEVNAIIQHRRESNEIDFDFMYGVGEMEDDDEQVEDDDDEADASNVLSVVGDDMQEESVDEQDNSEDATTRTDDMQPAAPSDDGSVEQEDKPAPSETTVYPCSDDVPEAAST
ncbi:unnamed protein product [Phytophthora lilii]|uniref:Unnamed protein product n=1 Tax=Phytophthora lilii TaxID=2077276 RepID=A0A9W6TJH1_9STRA|nr:unnamed protein product [Phytophthora lilii]